MSEGATKRTVRMSLAGTAIVALLLSMTPTATMPRAAPSSDPDDFVFVTGVSSYGSPVSDEVG